MAKIEDVHLFTSVFGRFPSFHDAEVRRINLIRKDVKVLPTLEAQIYVFEMTSEVREGRYVLKNESLVTLGFFEIDGLTVSDFNNQNVLQDLYIQDVSDRQMENIKFDVSFDWLDGLDAKFSCRAIRVLSVTPI